VTFIAELQGDPDALETLSSIADDLGGAAEDWSGSRVLSFRMGAPPPPRSWGR
jgi:hypothetical protein